MNGSVLSLTMAQNDLKSQSLKVPPELKRYPRVKVAIPNLEARQR